VRGSSSSSSVLAEAVRAGHAPAAILLGEADLILAVGAAVGEELYGVRVPVLVLSSSDLASIRDAQQLHIDEDGRVT
jgi:predicted aconitase with swiveling domain